MRPTLLFLTLAAMLAGCGPSAAPGPNPTSPTELEAAPRKPVPVRLRAADGAAVFGRLWRAEKTRAIILLFHQAGSSKDEFDPIGPRLARDGYTALAIDARAGGDLFGRNETIAALGHDAGYGPAKQDLQAAIDWAANEGPPVLMLGSSYAAALVFPMAVANTDRIAAVLAFSPAEYLGPGDPVRQAAARLTIPAFVTGADARELEAAGKIAAAVPGDRATLYRPATGVHGASTLRADRNPQGAAANFDAVEKWLGAVVK